MRELIGGNLNTEELTLIDPGFMLNIYHNRTGKSLFLGESGADGEVFRVVLNPGDIICMRDRISKDDSNMYYMYDGNDFLHLVACDMLKRANKK